MNPTLFTCVPDLDQARTHLALLDPSANAQFGFRTFDDRKATGEADHRLAVLCRGTLDSGVRQSGNPEKDGKPCRPSRLLQYMADKWSAGVFVVVNELDAGGQRAGNVTRVRALHVDCDDDRAIDHLKRFINATGLEPTILVASGGITSAGAEKIQCYWRVDGCLLEQFERAQLLLISRIGSDPAVHDLSRVLRLPGYWHRKKEPRMARIVEARAGLVYPIAEFLRQVEREPLVVPAMNALRLGGMGSRGRPAARFSGVYAKSALNQRMRTLMHQHGGLVVPALDRLLAEATGPGSGPGNRHATLVSAVAKLSSKGWSDEEVVAFVLPRANAWGDGDWSSHLSHIVAWVRDRATARGAALGALFNGVGTEMPTGGDDE